MRGMSMETPEPESKDHEAKKKNKMTAIRAVATVSAFLAPMVLAAVMFMLAIGITPGGCGCTVPTGDFGDVEVLGPTSVNIDFGRITGEPRPMDLKIELEADYSLKSVYTFSNNGDGELVPEGASIGTITYSDIADNWKVNIGDKLKITDLESDSDYIIRLYWEPTGDLITETSFSTSP